MTVSKKSKVVVITGASAGVGRATAEAFARRGARIGLLARGRDGLEATRKDVETLGGTALIIPTDVADFEQVESAARAVEETFGSIDVWINNAMVTIVSPFKEVTPEEFRRVTEVTYLGIVYGTMAALKRMLPRNHGVIVQVGSALAYRAIPLQSPYCGAKHAVRGFTDSLRSELLHDGSEVRVTTVHLPALNTPQFNWCKTRMPRHPRPVPPVFQPEVAAEAIVWAAHNHPRELNVGLPTVKAIWANKIMPGFLDRYLALKGYDAQQMNEPVNPNRADNLWSAVEGNAGSHGRFDKQARLRSWQLWARMHAASIAFAAAILLGSGVIAMNLL
jgi:NAD(P)-dependent dehydrogenase (short-subunit alcohol dehydrogenase family)